MMREAQAVGEALGVRFRISLEKRIAGAEAVGAHKTSMLQDIETGRAIEADALIGSVSELGRIVGVATPHIDAIYAVVKLLGETLVSCERSSRGDAGVTYFDETNACGEFRDDINAYSRLVVGVRARRRCRHRGPRRDAF